MFERYATIIKDKSDIGIQGVPETYYSHLRGMCALALENIDTYPIDKLSRWLGYIQAVLVQRKLVTVESERNFSRPLFHAAYAAEAIEIPKTQDAARISH